MPEDAHPSSGDPEDVRRAALGDRASFERLVVRHQEDVVSAAYYYLGSYEDAVDVAQDTFLKAFRGITTFRGGASFRTWLLTIALNTARSLRSRSRARKRTARMVHIDQQDESAGGGDEAGIAVADPDRSTEPATLLQRKEVKEALEQAIAELEEDSRQVIVLRDIAGESYEAIADLLGIPTGTVKSRVHRARLELQARMAPWV